MTVPIDRDQVWLTGKVTKLLTKCYRRGVADETIVAVFGELLAASQVSAESVLEALKKLTTSDDGGSDQGVDYIG